MSSLTSPLMQGRGLKPGKGSSKKLNAPSPLMQGRGLKRLLASLARRLPQSPLMQGRGLKLVSLVRNKHKAPASPLMQGRGLKQHDPNLKGLAFNRRPLCRGVD